MYRIPVAVLRKVDGELPEGHFIIIIDDKKHREHDVPLAEDANKKIQEHYR